MNILAKPFVHVYNSITGPNWYKICVEIWSENLSNEYDVSGYLSHSITISLCAFRFSFFFFFLLRLDYFQMKVIYP